MALVSIVMWVLEAFFYRARSLYPIFRIEPDVLLGLVLVVTTPKLWLSSVGESGLSLAGLIALFVGG